MIARPAGLPPLGKPDAVGVSGFPPMPPARPKAPATDPGHELATLLLAARDDAALRRQLLFLLRAPPWQRQSLVNTAIHEMTLRGEPRDARAAFALLVTDEGAKAALAILQSQ